MSEERCLSPVFPYQKAVCTVFLMPHLSHSSCLYHPNNNWRRAKIMNLLRQFFPASNIVLSTLLPNSSSLCSSLNVRDRDSHICKTEGNIRVCSCVHFIAYNSGQLTGRQETGQNGINHSLSSACTFFRCLRHYKASVNVRGNLVHFTT